MLSDYQKRLAKDVMCQAHSYCPTDLSHMEKMRWMGEYVAKAAIERDGPVADGWLPIETAPRDGTEILAFIEWYDGPCVEKGSFKGDKFFPAHRNWESKFPVRWMPLPPSPWAAAPGAATPEPAPFRASVCPMQASNGVTYVVSLERGDRPEDAKPWDREGLVTPINRNDVQEANDEGQYWADFLGVPFTPCNAVEGRLPNTVPEYGGSIASTAPEVVVVPMIEQRLRAVLDVVQRYLPPDGIPVDAAMSEIIGLVDPWPQGELKP